MITEQEFCIQWRRLMVNVQLDAAACSRADALIEALPETSPLRLRYAKEFSDLQRIRAEAGKPAAKPAKRRAGR